ncbi:hypothetical protein C8A01DRAFT_48778 [Parachaetomium inaequale]|uniref:2EXR domain-containing protein n=1 Tax=Parachaetomium inaequale TaxID=2588326 RepID=A0AAN6SPL7_9PEZI|nr:hypothetical protein C8A01DRAFT_48778 [Parachaetomium inaequale]
MSDSEESDHIGYLVAQSGDDEPGSEGPGSDDDMESGSGSESPPESNGFFDLEAADSDDERSGPDESDADQDHDGIEPYSEDYFFPQFKRLPFELRHRIWEFFCPDLIAKSHVFWFQANYDYGFSSVTIGEGPFLEQQTRPARAMLALHRETRELALKAFPDTLVFGSHGFVRFDSERDVVVLGSTETVMMNMEEMPPLPGFGEHIRHLAVDLGALDGLGDRSSAMFGAFENLETAYYLTHPTNHKPQHLRWCVSDLAKHYSVTTFEEQPGVGEDGQHLYCWPDIENPRAFAEADLPLGGLAGDLQNREDLVVIDFKEVTFNGAPIWPMVHFLWESGLRRFDDLRTWDGQGAIEWESSDEEDDEEPDEYESEGIDDSVINDDSLSSEDEHLIVLDDDDHSSQGEEAGEEGSGLDGAINLTGDDDENIARFSSPEQSSATLQGSDESAHESDRPAARPSRLKRPRGRVVESDSDDDSEDGGPRKRARTDTRSRPIVLSSDDEEDEQQKMRANRRARAVISEDEDDEDSENGNGNTGDVQDGRADWSSISSSEEEDEESDGGAAVAKPLSLAEKLQLHRERNPTPPSDDEDSEVEERAGDDYDARDYADFQDDEEANEVLDDEDDDHQYGVMGEDDDEGQDYEY